MSDSKFVGVDGFSCGWFSVGINGNGEYEAKPFFSFVDLLAYYDAAKLILVDMPIGLTNGPEKRRCDTQARRSLKSSSKVFRPPHRRTAYKVQQSPIDYRAAARIEQHFAQNGLTTESFGFAPQVAEVDRVMSPPDSEYRNKVREVHPEICFWALNKRRAMKSKKDNQEGLKERIKVLGRVEPTAEKVLDAAWYEFRNNCVKKDDILDALVAAVTAYRGWPCWLHALPEAPRKSDECNLPIQDAKTELPMEMVFWEPFRHFNVRIP